MKKQAYMKPAAQVVRLQQMLLQAASLTEVNSNADLNLGGKDSGTARSREYYNWEEEDEDNQEE